MKVLVLVVVIVPVKVVVVGSGQPRTEEQNLDADAVLLITELIDATHDETLGTDVQDGAGSAIAKENV